ncbi:hypothetical protein G7Y79_00003g008550 [Physcia stellaris]|nr:hypothetical protein G7Y79_00003g008550 [Physcia stellaris]
MPPKTLYDLPSEVVHQILLLLDPVFLPALELVSKQFARFVDQPLLWQNHCLHQFKYWNCERNIKGKLAENVNHTNWKALYAERYRIDRDVSREIESILSTQTSRILKATKIVDFGYEAKDTLLRHCAAADDAEDVLARRVVPLEKALAAFDIFTSHNQEEDFEKISESLDTLAKEVREQCPRLFDQTLRQQALEITNYLRRNNFQGVRHDAQYHDLPNNFIGMALRDEEHQTLPLVLVAIYCCVAQRLGIDAQPCAFPHHVHVIIKAPDDQDLDGRTVVAESESSYMYLDPWRSSDETPKGELIQRLQILKIDPSHFSALLGPSSTAEIVRRNARNVWTSVQMVSQTTGVGGHLSPPPAFPGTNDAAFGALWALLLLPEGQGHQIKAQQKRLIPYVLHHITQNFPLDLGIFEKNALPSFHEQDHFEQLRDSVLRMLAVDDAPKETVITGWDVECAASEAWIAQMNVRSLPGGQHQAFYHVMVEDKSVRYVAEENVRIVTPNVATSELMAIAGQHFKRWDFSAKCFVSNVRDEYPDD